MSINKLVVFDLDGTISISHLYTVPAQKLALKEFGVENISDEKLISCLGEKPILYAASFLPNHTNEQHLEYLERELYWEKELMNEKAQCFDGIKEALDTLKVNGYKIAICSNSAVSYIEPVIKALQIESYIDFIQPIITGKTKSDTLKLLLQNTKARHAVMIGDRIFDKLAAQDNNIKFIGCLYGFNPDEVNDADITVASGFEITTAVKTLIG